MFIVFIPFMLLTQTYVVPEADKEPTFSFSLVRSMIYNIHINKGNQTMINPYVFFCVHTLEINQLNI